MTADESTRSFVAAVTTYEKAILLAETSLWFDATITAIDSVMQASVPLGMGERGVADAAREHWYTRLAAALTTFISHPATGISLEQLNKLSTRKQSIAYIFNASGHRSMKHLVSIIGAEHEGQIKLDLKKAPMLLAVTGLDDIPPELIDIALAEPPELLLILMLGWLNQRAVLTRQGLDNRSKLLHSGRLIEDVEIGDQDIGNIVNAWMYCTYADCAHKHQIKRSFNKLLLARMGELPSSLSIAEVNRPKPKVVVVHERFIAAHAMFRCYAPLIRGLRNHFEVVAISEEETIDAESDDLFDHKILLPKGPKTIRSITDIVCKESPDIIYYPSLGMSHWTVLLAQLRLAPLQIMTHGHPATSMSPVIDYVYLNEIDGDLATQHSEKVLVGPSNLSFQPHSELPSHLPGLLPPSAREVRVAVNSKVMKLSPRLMDICERLCAESERPVRFSFFPGERNMLFDGLSAAIKTRLPSADVIPYVDYSQFLDEMAKCDLALAAFPFGNTNSTVDTSLLGLPTVVHCGDDSSGQTDSLVMRTAGLPEWLICRTDEEYFSTALSLINDPEKRLSAMEGLSREAIRDRLFGAAEKREDEVFAEMLWHAYLRHDQIQASEQRVFHYKEWLDN
jgi:hypothetical protein